MLTRRKTLVSLSASAILFISSCSQSQKVAIEASTNETIVSSSPPFQTKEPERYRATRTITIVTAAGETTVTRNSIMRNGELRRDQSVTAGQQVVYLNRPDGRFIVLPNERVFADLTNVDHARDGGNEDESESSPNRLLHTDPITTSYQQIGAETVGGRTAQKYRVVVNGSTDANVSPNETVIWIDEALQMPIKSETRSTDGTRSTMELSEIQMDVDSRVFLIPDDYEKITFTELRKRLQRD